MKVEIIIPTIPGRGKYLYSSIQSCLSNVEDNCLVLISSNGGAAEVRDVVASFDNSRIRLVESDSFLPMASHWEFACSHTVGDVISIIGDDDAIVPGAIHKVVELFYKFPRSECVTHMPAQYYWPDYPIKSFANKYFTPKCTGHIEVVNSHDVLKKVIEMKEWYGRLPNLYHGFVKAGALERIRSTEGAIFKRIAPDIYSDFALGWYVENIIRADYCLTVGGQGAKSNGANLILDTEIGREFWSDLPEHLMPKFSGKSINLQIFEYSRLFIDRVFTEESANSAWMMFVLRTLAEAARAPQYSDEIVNDIKKIIASELPVYSSFFYRGLITLVKNEIISAIFTVLSEKRQQMKIRCGKDARNQDAVNAYDVAQHLRHHLI